VAIYAGFCSGAVLGACLITRKEALRRGATPKPIDPFERVPVRTAINAILHESLVLSLAAAMMMLVGLGITRLGGLQHLDGATNLPFGLALFAGAALAKFARYLYWHSRN
jgi:hypothetical protein